MSGTHPFPDRSVDTGSAVERSGRSRAERLVRPEVAARYIDGGDRLGAVLIGFDAAMRAVVSRLSSSVDAKTKHHPT